MSFQEERQTRLRRQASKQAVLLAMQGRWREAVEANKAVLDTFPNDVDAYNRLGRAYMELGEYRSSREAYEKALQLDPYNSIAQKNLGRLAHLKEAERPAAAETHKVEPQQFIEEVGKAGVVRLQRVAPPAVLAKVVAGDKVNLRVEGVNLIAENTEGQYLGIVDSKHGLRLIKLMEGGNQYSATVVSSRDNEVTVIVREVYQHPSQVGKLSFPPKEAEGFRPYVAERMIRREIEEYEEATPAEPGYHIVGSEGEETAEFLGEDATDIAEEAEEEE